MFQALLVFSKESSFFVSAKHKTKVNLHWIFNTIATVLILIAYACIYKNKENNLKAHLTTWHGLFGFITICYTVVQWIAGHFLTIFHDKIRHLIPYNRLHVYHSTSGVILYFLITVTFTLSFGSNWYKGSTPVYVQYLSFVAVAILALMVSTQVASKFVMRQNMAAARQTNNKTTNKT
jgi:hypothetical protein